MLTFTGLISLFLLLCTSVLSALSTSLQRMGRLEAEEELKKRTTPFFFRALLPRFFGKQKWEGLLFSLSFTKHLLRIAFVLTFFLFLLDQFPSQEQSPLSLFLFAAATLFLSLIVDLFASLVGQIHSQTALHRLSPLASFILLLCIPVTAPFFKIVEWALPKASIDKRLAPGFRIRDKVEELLQETELGAYLDANEKKLILSVVSFKDRIAREVMVPRINLFSLPSDTSIHEAALSFLSEGYSRIPVYKDSVDNIIGVLLYKDVLKLFVELKENTHKLNQPVEKIVTPVLYTPETKKISHLLQEFRSKQIHMAIIVDEWGGTEGIVTIEDILEELVGEIADEFDVGPQDLFSSIATGGWIVDAKMSIIDIEEELGIQIPPSPEYDTIGGYIFHRAGSIPSKGWRLHHDEFDLEVLSSTERALDKIKITPHLLPNKPV
jgi:CBS domain containing-hemolysin-like protein